MNRLFGMNERAGIGEILDDFVFAMCSFDMIEDGFVDAVARIKREFFGTVQIAFV